MPRSCAMFIRMSERGGAVHVVTTRRRYKGRVYETHLLRRSYREDRRVKNETLGNLSHLPPAVVDLVRRALHGETFVPVAERLEVLGSRPHGSVQAVRLAMQRLGIESLIGSRPSPERDRILALIGARNLAARHLGEGSLALYDLSSSYFEGTHCPLAKIGYSRDRKKNKPQVNYGLMTTRQGCPICVSVYEGNTADPKTLMPQVLKLKECFALERVVLVGDRGMISHKAIGELKDIDGMAWITALKSTQIRGLVEAGALQLGLFDERNLFEFSDPAYPGERLIACRNPELAKLRAYKRQALIERTRLEREETRERIARGALESASVIGVKLWRVYNRVKVGKHFELTITDTAVKYQILEPQVAAEAALDGIYVIRTGIPKKQMSAPEAVRSYKALAQVERAFRSLKTVDLKIRPIHHRLENRVRAHIFLCMLAYYVEWHLIEAWRPLLFADEDQTAKATRDPVAPAKRSAAALEKVHSHFTEHGTPAHSLRTLLAELATLVRNTCRTPGALEHPATFDILTTPTDLQRRAFALVEQIAV